MERTFDFTVNGVPPKKDGANSMWNKGSERDRLVELRRAAAACVGSSGPLSTGIRLTLELHLPRVELERIGDLDNFITGVCDGLMSCARNTPTAAWTGCEEGVHPRRCIAIRDDRYVVEIVARKTPSDKNEAWYRVVLCGE